MREPWGVGQRYFGHPRFPCPEDAREKPIAQWTRVTARNDPDDWGPSDHCRVEITVE